jgi:hypothetical protein
MRVDIMLYCNSGCEKMRFLQPDADNGLDTDLAFEGRLAN